MSITKPILIAAALIILNIVAANTVEERTHKCSLAKSSINYVDEGNLLNVFKCNNASLSEVSRYYEQRVVNHVDTVKLKELYLDGVQPHNKNVQSHQKNPLDFILNLNKENNLVILSWIRSNLSEQDIGFLGIAERRYLHLRTLDLSRNQINQISRDNFSNIFNLRKFRLSNNRISQLPPKCFSPLVELKELYLNSNPLRNLTLDVFNGLGSLIMLDLSNASFTDLPRGVFEGLHSLQHLTLANNQIYLLPFQVFRDLKAIEELDLSHNLINTFLDNEFVLNRNLKMLNLKDNRIAKISQHVFYGLKSLETLDMSMNALISIDRNAFGTLDVLKHLNLMQNKLVSVSTSLFAALKNLQSLKLSENPLVNLPDGVFSVQYHMNELILEGTNLSRLGNWVSRNEDVVNSQILGNLKYLSIRNNKMLTEVDSVFFKNVQYLEVLYLSDNALSTLPKEIGHLKQLRLLDVSNNSLHNIPEQISQLPLVRYLNLLHNDYACDCHMVWIVGWVDELQRTNRTSPHELMRLSELKCRNGYPGDILRVLQHLNCIEPLLLDSSSDAKLYQLNKTALLKCTFIGNPQPEIVWVTPWNEILRHTAEPDQKPITNGKYTQSIQTEFISDQEIINDKPLPAGITVMENAYLRINEISRSDSGLYTCFVRNNMGNTTGAIRWVFFFSNLSWVHLNQ